jgi:hypothetical protein
MWFSRLGLCILLSLTLGGAWAANTSDFRMPYTAPDADAVDLYHTDYDAAQGSAYLNVVDYTTPYRWGNVYNVNVNQATSTTERFTSVIPASGFGTSLFFNSTVGSGGPRMEVSPAAAHIGDFKTSLTLEAWIRPARLNLVQRIITRGNCHSLYLTAAGEITFWVNFTDGIALSLTTSGAGLTVNTWAHIAGVWDGTNLEIYVNGVRKAHARYPGKPQVRKPNGTNEWQLIGANTDQTQNFNGYFDEVRISKAARFDTPNVSDYAQMYEPADGNTVDLYHFDYDPAQGATLSSIVDYSAPYRWGYTVNVNVNSATSDTERFVAQVPSSGFNRSLYLNGTNARMEVNPDPSHIGDFRTSLTLEAWIRPARVTGVQRLITRANCHSLYLSGSEVVFWTNFMDNLPLSISTSGAGIATNTWTHVAGVWDGTNLEIFINGVLRATAAYSGKPLLRKPNGTSDWQVIGASTGASEYYQGYLDEVRISKTARFFPTNTTNITRPFAGDSSSVDLYHFDYDTLMGSGYGGVVDYSAPYRWGNTQNVNLTNVTTERFNALIPQAGFGTSLYLNGTNGRVEISPSATHIGDFTNSLTLEAWIRPARLTGTQRIMERANCHSLYLVGNEIACFVNFTDNNPLTLITTGAGLAVNQWAHVAGVWDGTHLEIYVNGVRRAASLVAGKPALRKPNGSSEWQIVGASAGQTEYFQGNLDELRISRTARYDAVDGVAGLSAPSLQFTEAQGEGVDVEHGETSRTLTVTLNNTGSGALQVNSLNLSGSNAAEFTLVNPPALPLALAPGGNQPLQVRFAPPETVRTLGKSATLTIATDDPVNGNVQVLLQGDAVPVELSGFSAE